MLVEFRAATTALEHGNFMTGVAVPYGQYADIREHGVSFRERFAPGSIVAPKSATLRMTHARGVPLARVGAGTLSFRDSAEGLIFSAELPESRPDIREALERGDLDGSVSIGFVALRDKKTPTPGSRYSFTRDVLAAKLDHLAIVETPAYASAKGQLTQ
jgi:phage head maturation protease